MMTDHRLSISVAVFCTLIVVATLFFACSSGDRSTSATSTAGQAQTSNEPIVTTQAQTTAPTPVTTTTNITPTTTEIPITTSVTTPTAQITTVLTTTTTTTTTTVKVTTAPPETTPPTIVSPDPTEIVRGTVAWVSFDAELFADPEMKYSAETLDADCALIILEKGSAASRVAALGGVYYVKTELLTTSYPASAREIMAKNGGAYYKGKKGSVAIDAGHQNAAMRSTEPLGPGSTVQKAMLTAGTQGVATGINEYVLNLEVALRLRNELISRGYSVIMIRETHTVRLSNAARAEIANAYDADIFVRIHANGSADKSARGAYGLCMTSKNPFNGELHADSRRLADLLADAFCKETGVGRLNTWETDTMTGINWAKMPVTIIEMGYMSNYDEDKLMATDLFRRNAAVGMANGIDKYFEE